MSKFTYFLETDEEDGTIRLLRSLKQLIRFTYTLETDEGDGI